MARSKIELFNLDSEEGGIFRQLADGMTTTIFPGENAMLSVVRIDPHAMGEMHKHPEEQWGVMLSGSATRYQDEEEFQINKGDIRFNVAFGTAGEATGFVIPSAAAHTDLPLHTINLDLVRRVALESE